VANSFEDHLDRYYCSRKYYCSRIRGNPSSDDASAFVHVSSAFASLLVRRGKNPFVPSGPRAIHAVGGEQTPPPPLGHFITAARRASPSQLHCSSPISTTVARPLMGHGDLPPAAVRFCLQGVALRGQLRPRRKDGPSFPEGPAGQDPPRIRGGRTRRRAPSLLESAGRSYHSPADGPGIVPAVPSLTSDSVESVSILDTCAVLQFGPAPVWSQMQQSTRVLTTKM